MPSKSKKQSPEVKKAAKDAKAFASTKHKGLPEKVKKESRILNFENFVNESYPFFSYEDFPEKNLEDLVPKSKLIEEFEKFGLSCDEKANWQNEIQYIDNLEIKCVFTSNYYAGEFSKAIINNLQTICNNIGADDFQFDNNFNVHFYFDEEKHPELIKHN